MGRRIQDKQNDREGDTKILFKKSVNTLHTLSKTCSGVSQFSTKSGILLLKRNLQKKQECFSDRGKVKRDFSVETDVCILRRFCRSKMNKVSNFGSSAKSKFSSVDIDTVEVFPDASACGDNQIVDVRSNYRTDVETLMVDNLKNLFNQWIQKHLKHNKYTEQKIDTVLNSILQNEDNASSDITYVVHRQTQNQEVKNKKIATSSTLCHYCKQKLWRDKNKTSSSRHTVPCHCKDVRIISTLSIPRTFHKPRLNEHRNKGNSKCKLKKSKRKSVVLSIDKFDKLLGSSSYDLVALSSRSLTKKFANYDINVKKKKHIVFFPKPLHKSPTDSSTISIRGENIKIANIKKNKIVLDEMPSLLRSLYVNNMDIITTSVDKNVQFNTKYDNFTMTENVSREFTTHVSHHLVKKSVGFNKNTKLDMKKDTNKRNKLSNVNKTTHTHALPGKSIYSHKKSTERSGKINKRRRQFSSNLTPKSSRVIHMNNRKFTFLYKKANNQTVQGVEFLKHWQNILQYFTEYNDKNMKVDVHINVFPMCEYGTKDVCTEVSSQALSSFEMKENITSFYNVQPSALETSPFVQPIVLNTQTYVEPTIVNKETRKNASINSPPIIPILDGAASQAKYIFDTNSKDTSEIKTTSVNRATLTNELEILQEISELKTVIKDLAKTAEKFVSVQLKKESKKSDAKTYTSPHQDNNKVASSKYETMINIKNRSKATQISTEIDKNQTKSVMTSKKKDAFEYYNRLTKKSTSYRIIDSESLLKVTDMTSKATEINKCRFADQALTCSLPKSRSLFEIPTERNNKLIAFFCDNCVKPTGHSEIHNNMSTDISNKRSNLDKKSNTSKRWYMWSKKEEKLQIKADCSALSSSHSTCMVPMGFSPDGAYSTTLSYNSTNSTPELGRQLAETDKNKSFTDRKKMSFGVVCLYCLMLWVPIIVILWLLYVHVLKDMLLSGDENTDEKFAVFNKSSMYLLSDLGF